MRRKEMKWMQSIGIRGIKVDFFGSLDSVAPGQLINADVDMVLGNDITTPVAIDEFEKYGFDSVYSKTGISIVLDHFVPNKDIKAAQLSKRCREFAGWFFRSSDT